MLYPVLHLYVMHSAQLLILANRTQVSVHIITFTVHLICTNSVYFLKLETRSESFAFSRGRVNVKLFPPYFLSLAETIIACFIFSHEVVSSGLWAATAHSNSRKKQLQTEM